MTDSLKEWLPYILRGLPAEFTEVAFRYGYFCALNKGHWEQTSNKAFNGLYFKWDYWYRQVRIHFNAKATPSDTVLSNVCHLDIVSIDTFIDYGNSEIDRVNDFVIPVETALSRMIPGINLVNSIRNCECAFHKLADTYATYYSPATICTQMSGKWVCEKCQEYIEKKCILPFAVPKNETSDQQKERAKLTSTMRFQVLERDEFRCKACGANPRDDKSVKLHVDHITPIAKDGKTTLENLQCLCSKCNIAKSDKIVEQMSLWGETA